MIDFMKLQAVIWDMDGVLVDSESIHINTWQTIFEKYHIQTSLSQLKRAFGMNSEMTVRTIANKPLDANIITEIVQEKARTFQKVIAEKAAFLPGVQGWLASFQKNHIRQAVASSGSPRNIEIVLEKLQINDYFDVVVDGKGIPSKPEPFIFLKATDQLEVIPLNCLVIEDSIAGVQAAKAAGMKCVAVATTTLADQLTGADVVVENLAQLMTDQVQGLFSA